jgi:hypothetical protein
MDNETIDQPDPNKKDSFLGNTIVEIVSHLTAIPVFIILHRFFPDLDWKFNIDRILLFVITIIIVEIIFHSIRKLVMIGFVVAILWLTYGSIWGSYGYVNLYKDYRNLVFSMIYNPHPESLIIQKVVPFPNKSKIIEAVDYNNPIVRNFAIAATTKYFNNEKVDLKFRTIIQCFAVFKEINSRWNYVSDPNGAEYFAKASESVQHLSGDCDDHSILMAACIKAIGGTARLIHTKGHLYPELLIGKQQDFDEINYIIKHSLFDVESGKEPLHYHTDDYGQIWLNMDYTAKYPGGKFMAEEVLHVLAL